MYIVLKITVFLNLCCSYGQTATVSSASFSWSPVPPFWSIPLPVQSLARRRYVLPQEGWSSCS